MILLGSRVKYAEEILSMENLLPDSILLSIFLAHCTKASSTFSPVRALVSKNISSKSDIKQNTKLCLENDHNSITDSLFGILFERRAKWNLLLTHHMFLQRKPINVNIVFEM